MASVIQLDGNTLSPAEVYAVASENIEIKLSDDSWNRIVKSRKVVEDILDLGLNKALEQNLRKYLNFAKYFYYVFLL